MNLYTFLVCLDGDDNYHNAADDEDRDEDNGWNEDDLI